MLQNTEDPVPMPTAGWLGMSERVRRGIMWTALAILAVVAVFWAL